MSDLSDEVVALLDENIGIAKVSLKRNLGFNLAMTASAFALLGTFLNWIVALALMITTNNDHPNLTNAEIEWQKILEEREMVTIKHSLGKNLMKRTHLNFMKARIGGKVSFYLSLKLYLQERREASSNRVGKTENHFYWK